MEQQPQTRVRVAFKEACCNRVIIGAREEGFGPRKASTVLQWVWGILIFAQLTNAQCLSEIHFSNDDLLDYISNHYTTASWLNQYVYQLIVAQGYKCEAAHEDNLYVKYSTISNNLTAFSSHFSFDKTLHHPFLIQLSTIFDFF